MSIKESTDKQPSRNELEESFYSGMFKDVQVKLTKDAATRTHRVQMTFLFHNGERFSRTYSVAEMLMEERGAETMHEVLADLQKNVESLMVAKLIRLFADAHLFVDETLGGPRRGN